jgi:rhodanese-related sulfurtransferase
MFYDEKGKYDMDAWLAGVANIANKDEPLILICHSGSRSKKLAEYLVKEVGYQTVYNVKKGIISWIKEKNIVILTK